VEGGRRPKKSPDVKKRVGRRGHRKRGAGTIRPLREKLGKKKYVKKTKKLKETVGRIEGDPPTNTEQTGLP